MKKLWTIFMSCTATACLSCTSPEDQPTNKSLTQAPLPNRFVDLSPLVTEDLPLRVWGKKMLTDWGFYQEGCYRI